MERNEDSQAASLTITVEAKVMGQRRPVIDGRRLLLPLSAHDEAAAPATVLPLRALVALIVRQEVRDFTQRQDERRLTRVLAPDDIARGTQAGKIAAGGLGADSVTEVDPEAAVRVALQAFEDGLYFVFVDERQYQDLDDLVSVSDESAIQFIRLVALAGGEGVAL